MLYKGSLMWRPLLSLLVLAAASSAVAQTTKRPEPGPSLSARIAGLKKQQGFLPFYWDEKKGTVLFV